MTDWGLRSELEDFVADRVKKEARALAVSLQQAMNKNPQSPEEQTKAKEEMEIIRRQLDANSRYLEQLKTSPLTTLYRGTDGREVKSVIKKIIRHDVKEGVREYFEQEENKMAGIPEVVKQYVRKISRRNRHLLIGAALFAALSAAGAAVYIAYKTKTAEIVNASNISSQFESYKQSNDSKIKLLEEKLSSNLENKISELESRVEEKSVQRENSLRKGLEVQIAGAHTDITALKGDIISAKDINASLQKEQVSLREYFNEIKNQIGAAEKEYSQMVKKEELSRELIPLTKQLDELKIRLDSYEEILNKTNADAKNSEELYKNIRAEFNKLKKDVGDATTRMDNFMLRYDSGRGE